jgi:hypothetical protein
MHFQKKLVGIKAVVFDLSGTLVQTREAGYSRAQLVKQAASGSGASAAAASVRTLTNNLGLPGAAQLFDANLSPCAVASLGDNYITDMSAPKLYPEVWGTLASLRAGGIKIGLSSYLAPMYIESLKRLLPLEPDVYAWKAEAETTILKASTLQRLCSAFACQPYEVVIIGSAMEAPWPRPHMYGAQQFQLMRDGGRRTEQCLRTIDEILPKLGLRLFY